MKKIVITTFSIVLAANFVISQEIGKCALTQAIKKKQETDKFFSERINHTKNTLSQLATQRGTNAVVYMIPVVFHILHQGGPENISNDQVYDAIKQMNNDFRKRNADTSNTVPEYTALAADCEIEFRLATIDPNGNCTNGIIRHYTTNTDFTGTYDYSGVGAGLWDPQQYMNIYVCRNLDFPGAAAYTYIPGWLGAGSSMDAIVSLHSYIGTIGTASPIAAHVISHEVGHWLGLSHVWGDSNNPGVACGDDGVADTPITKGWQSCNLSSNKICNPTVVENVQNFMEYSYCETMFTLGQKQLMRNVIATGANAGRDLLVSPANLLATGITSPQICAPIADFKTVSGLQNYCTGQTIQFRDNTLNAPITNWNWSFTGASPVNSIDSMPIVNYASPGIYPVSYTATNVSGSSFITKNTYIEIVNNIADVQTPMTESFESITVPNALWKIPASLDAITWTQNNILGCTGIHSMMINNYTNTPADVETLYCPSYNIAAINSLNSPLAFTFKLAYQQKNSSANERLQVYSSSNCGQTWFLRYSKGTSLLATVAGYNASAYVPSSAADWRTETISVNALLNLQNVLFKFVFTSDASGNSNNIYIDDINLVQNTIGMNDIAASIADISIVPNPSTGENTLLLVNLNKSSDIKIDVVDILGKSIESSVYQAVSEGEHPFNLFKNASIATGVYFVKISVAGNQLVKRIVIE